MALAPVGRGIRDALCLDAWLLNKGMLQPRTRTGLAGADDLLQTLDVFDPGSEHFSLMPPKRLQALWLLHAPPLPRLWISAKS